MMYLVMLCSRCIFLLEYFSLCTCSRGCGAVGVGYIQAKMGFKHLRALVIRELNKYGNFSNMVFCVICELVVMNVYIS